MILLLERLGSVMQDKVCSTEVLSLLHNPCLKTIKARTRRIWLTARGDDRKTERQDMNEAKNDKGVVRCDFEMPFL